MEQEVVLEVKNLKTYFYNYDRELRAVNSDYDAKRQTALDPPRIHAVPPGTTLRWLQKTGKNKLPRMRNDRTVVEQLLKIEQ